MISLFASISIIALVANADSIGDADTNVATALGISARTLDWDTLKTTWNINPFNGFFDIPLTADKAKSKGWDLLISCSDDNIGNVYYKDDDLSSMPIYNADGIIAGFILGLKDPGASSQTIPWTKYTVSSKGITFWGITAFYRDPVTICSASGSSSQAEDYPIGDRLWIRNGESQSNGEMGTYWKAPLYEDETFLDLYDWRKGKCFFTMGRHYWRYMTVDMDCNEAYPIFLLYGGFSGKLLGWGIAMDHDDRPRSVPNSNRWEHPAASQTGLFFGDGDWPQCLQDLADEQLTTQHVFFTNPANSKCSIFG